MHKQILQKIYSIIKRWLKFIIFLIRMRFGKLRKNEKQNERGRTRGNGKEKVSEKEIAENRGKSLVGNMVSQGTTPRRYVNLLASLMDLTSGSGDRCTPVVLVKNYFR